MFRRKLLALNHAEAKDITIVPSSSDKSFQNLVLWLEDQKIRHYKIELRSDLRSIGSPKWEAAYKKYLLDLECPILSGNNQEELEWLLTFSVSLEYSDKLEKYNNESLGSGPQVKSNNPLDNLDFHSEEFIQGVNSLATILQIDKQPDHLLTLSAITRLVSTRFSESALKDPRSVIPQGEPFPFEEADSGFTLGDPVLNRAAKILRLLYIHDLRQLQTKINECIVAVQSITANPKTDTKLGQVGR